MRCTPPPQAPAGAHTPEGARGDLAPRSNLGQHEGVAAERKGGGHAWLGPNGCNIRQEGVTPRSNLGQHEGEAAGRGGGGRGTRGSDQMGATYANKM
eukprot:350301-Chlamydomonas_euryale.AAC.1